MNIISITSPLIWTQLKYFSPNENWGDPNKIDVRLLWWLDRIREDLARPIIVHCAYETEGHSENSFHKLGMAVDFHFENTTKEEFKDLYLNLLLVWHGGVGAYPYWNSPGFHLDLGKDRTWYRDEKGKYHYNFSELPKI